LNRREAKLAKELEEMRLLYPIICKHTFVWSTAQNWLLLAARLGMISAKSSPNSDDEALKPCHEPTSTTRCFEMGGPVLLALQCPG
jgi:hypothetical protein